MKGSKKCIIRNCSRARKDCIMGFQIKIGKSLVMTHLMKVIKTIKTKTLKLKTMTLQMTEKRGLVRKS